MLPRKKRPSVMFVCVKNGGNSIMAAGLITAVAGDDVVVTSAGTRPGAVVNPPSAQVLSERGVDVRDELPRQLRKEDMPATGPYPRYVKPLDVAGRD